jgi:hypothetical protein
MNSLFSLPNKITNVKREIRKESDNFGGIWVNGNLLLKSSSSSYGSSVDKLSESISVLFLLVSFKETRSFVVNWIHLHWI